MGQQLVEETVEWAVELLQLVAKAEVVEAGQKALLEQQLVQVVRRRASLEVRLRALVARGQYLVVVLQLE